MSLSQCDSDRDVTVTDSDKDDTVTDNGREVTVPAHWKCQGYHCQGCSQLHSLRGASLEVQQSREVETKRVPKPNFPQLYYRRPCKTYYTYNCILGVSFKLY